MKRDHLKNLESKILQLRNVDTLLDKDLAEALDIKTASLNLLVSKYPERFPKSSCFRLKESEIKSLLKSGLILKRELSKRNKPPRVFTETAAYMAAFLVQSDAARKLSQLVLNDILELHKPSQNP